MPGASWAAWGGGAALCGAAEGPPWDALSLPFWLDVAPLLRFLLSGSAAGPFLLLPAPALARGALEARSLTGRGWPGFAKVVSFRAHSDFDSIIFDYGCVGGDRVQRVRRWW